MNLIKQKNIYNSNEFLDNYNGVKLFIEKEKYDGISYNKKLNIELNKKNIIIYGNLYYYEYKFIKDCDIIDNIKINSDNVIIKIIIGNLEFDLEEIKEFYFISINYSSFIIKFIYDEIPDNKVITLSYRKYLINNNYRNSLIKSKIIIYSDENIYKI